MVLLPILMTIHMLVKNGITKLKHYQIALLH